MALDQIRCGVEQHIDEHALFERAIKTGEAIGALNDESIARIAQSDEGRQSLMRLQSVSEKMLGWFHAGLLTTSATVMTAIPNITEAAGRSPKELATLTLASTFAASIISVVARVHGLQDEIKEILERINKGE